MARYQRLARLLELISVIKYHPDWGPKRLAEYFEISEKRIYDDINELNAANLPIYYNGRGYSFHSQHSLPPVQFTLDEVTMLLMSGAMLRRQCGEPYAAALRTAAEKLLLLLPEETRALIMDVSGRLDGDTKGRAQTAPALRQFNRALVEKRTVRFTYESFSSGRVTRRKADPYAVVYRGTSWYVIGFCHTRREVRTFRVNRSSDVRLTQTTFDYPDDFSIKEHLEKSWAIFQGDEVEVAVRFSKKIAPLIRENQWHPVQQITEHADGSITYKARVRGTLEIRRWILSWGRHAEVLGPESFRREMQEITGDMAAAYRKKTARVAEERKMYSIKKPQDD